MKRYLKILLFVTIIVFFVFFLLNKYWNENNDYKKAIFNIIEEKNIDLDNSWSKNLDYKITKTNKIIWKWFFINKSWEFLTSKHILNNNKSKYFIEIEKTKYEFNIINTYENKDIVLWEIKKYKNNNFITYQSNRKRKIEDSKVIYVLKDNTKKYWKILKLNQKIDELELYDLIKTDLILEPWDSWSPLFNNLGEIIWINVAINKIEKTSFAQKL